MIRLDRNQPEFSRPAGAYIQNAVTPVRIAQARQRIDRVPWPVVQRFGVPSEILVGVWAPSMSISSAYFSWVSAQSKYALDML